MALRPALSRGLPLSIAKDMRFLAERSIPLDAERLEESANPSSSVTRSAARPSPLESGDPSALRHCLAAALPLSRADGNHPMGIMPFLLLRLTGEHAGNEDESDKRCGMAREMQRREE